MFVISSNAQSVDVYNNVKLLMLDGLKTQVVNAEIAGRMRAMFQKRFNTREPLLARVTTLKHYNQPGCKQLNIEFSMAKALLAKGIRETARLNQVISICPDGTPPHEGADISGFENFHKSRVRQYRPPKGMVYVPNTDQ